MATVVELGAVEGFILDDPVAGVLGNTVYTLGGTVFKDITSRVITINVTAGMGANGAQIGEQIVTAIKRYERSSGPVFASA